MRFVLEDLAPGQRIVWRQDLEGTPFEKAVSESHEAVEVVPTGSGSTVNLTISRKLKGTARLGRFFVSRGQRKELEAAAEALQGVFG
jgi:hypothetical protein